VYVDATVSDHPDVRIVGASLLIPPTAVFSGRTAGYMLGAPELFDVGSPVEVTVPPGQRFGPVTGLKVREARLPASEVRSIRGRVCTTAVRTAVDIARREPVLDAVAAIDVMLHRALLLAEDLRGAAAELLSGRGCRQARHAIALTDGRAESPPESRVRVLLTLAGIPPVPQYRVLDRNGTFVARVDLAYPELRMAVEYDGLWHADGEQFRRDRRRLNRLVAEGWVVLHLTAADLKDPDGLVRRVRHLLAVREVGETGL
jgi:hypothetical protein